MKPLLLLAAVSLIPLGACTQAKAPRATLDCPATQGDLRRTAQAADGKSCTYVAANGLEVDLRLVPVSGSAFATLDQLETQLTAQAEAAAEASAKTMAAAQTQAAPGSADEARRVASQAAQDAAGVEVAAKETSDSEDGVDVHMEDGKVVVAEGGSTTRVNLPGIHIVADEEDDSASVRIGPLHVDAQGEEAIIHIRREVRLKGEALSRHKRGVRATFISHGEGLPNGARVVGYEAGGPKTGPLTVAVIRANDEVHDGDDVYRDVKRLVRKNGGV